MTLRVIGPVEMYLGDCLEVMRSLPAESVDAVVTDPPYGLGFMGKAWDSLPPGEEWAKQCLRVLKPGGYLLAFGGSRTWHRLAVAVEDAGFEIRDSIAWLYGSGFPKSLDVSKAIDKAAGATREVVGQSSTVTPRSAKSSSGFAPLRQVRWGDQHYAWEDAPAEAIAYFTAQGETRGQITAPATDDARRWEGWGTALKPAFEPIVVGRKPLVGTVAANVLAHGTGALNIDACRVETSDDLNGGAYAAEGNRSESASLHAGSGMNVPGATTGKEYVAPAGRWPANVVLDESQAAELDAQSGTLKSGANPTRRGADGDRTAFGEFAGQVEAFAPRGVDSGGASRFFPTFRYQAKAPTRERPKADGVAHPTVKPLELMRWLVRLVTPPGGTVLEPFAGSGTTVEACLLERAFCIAIEREASYLPLILRRIERQTKLPEGWLDHA